MDVTHGSLKFKVEEAGWATWEPIFGRQPSTELHKDIRDQGSFFARARAWGAPAFESGIEILRKGRPEGSAAIGHESALLSASLPVRRA